MVEAVKVVPNAPNPENYAAIQALCKQQVKSSTLPDDAFEYMAKLVEEDTPRNAAELYSLIGDFLTDGMAHTEDSAYKVCEVMSKILLDKKLIVVEQRDTIMAEKLSNPVVLNQMSSKGNIVRDEDFLDPFTGIDRSKANQNSQFDAGQLSAQTSKAQAKAKDALDKKIAEFSAHKQRIPKPEVRHEMGEGFKKDINVSGVTIIVGGKTLLDNATMRFVKGKKYGLVGRNGIGKTCLINAISRGEIEKFPADIHILQVEQEVEKDSITVLQHILNCDVERTELMEQLEEFSSLDESDMTEAQIGERAIKMGEINERLIAIYANESESKAIKILTGIGFSQGDLNRPSNSFSGGWRMRIAIAKVIFAEPEILMLDEPTNHLDLPALIWLEAYIQDLTETTVIIVSHARDFLDATVDEIIHFQDQKLTYYKGNFEQFTTTKNEKDKNAKRAREGQLDKIAHVQKFIDKFRYNAKRATLVQSRIKAIQRIDVVAEVV